MADDRAASFELGGAVRLVAAKTWFDAVGREQAFAVLVAKVCQAALLVALSPPRKYGICRSRLRFPIPPTVPEIDRCAIGFKARFRNDDTRRKQTGIANHPSLSDVQGR